MWRPSQIPAIAGDLKKMGLEIDPRSLTDLTAHPMNAVISLGGCSASFVSTQGLIVTNHHCALGSIQYNSKSGRNLIEDGFLARSLDQELQAAPGTRVFVTEEFRDVTREVTQGLEGLTGAERFAKLESRRKGLIAQCEKTPGYRCQVSSYHGGLQFSLIRQLGIRDVRLVYAPASGIGKFGGEIDNWMWPRHTGDFAFLRAYVDAAGRPADFSPENRPFRPTHHLRVAQGDLDEGDFVMVAGYPGVTNRYRTAAEVENMFRQGYPLRIKVYGEWLGAIQAASQGRNQAEIAYASLRAGLENVLKNNRGMLDGFDKGDMLQRKKALESELSSWIQASPQRRERYGAAMSKLDQMLAESHRTAEADFLYRLAGRSDLLQAARQLYQLALEKRRPDAERNSAFQERNWATIRQGLERIDRRFDAKVDRAAWKTLILAYHRLPAGSRVEAYDRLMGLRAGSEPGEDLERRLDDLYSKTDLMRSERRMEMMEWSLEQMKASSDSFIQLAAALYESDRERVRRTRRREGSLQQLRPQYMQALIEFLEGKGRQVYPDANGTLRITYGKVRGYSPRDGVDYTPFTSAHGIVAKDTGQEPFNTPQAALSALRQGRFGAYSDPDLGSLAINFLSDVDTTGGNSGSPTLNSKGELIGLLFDGNYESMIADWDFMPEITRSIHVDIRYVLWLMDDVDKARHLLEEMGLRHSGSETRVGGEPSN